MRDSHMAIHKQGGQLKLANPSKMVHELLHSTAMNRVFDIQPDTFLRRLRRPSLPKLFGYLRDRNCPPR